MKQVSVHLVFRCPKCAGRQYGSSFLSEKGLKGPATRHCHSVGCNYSAPQSRDHEHYIAEIEYGFDNLEALEKFREEHRPPPAVAQELKKRELDESWKHKALTVGMDFDGVIHSYTGPWTRIDEINDPPQPGALEAVLDYIGDGMNVVVFTCRALEPEGAEAVKAWLKKNNFPELEVTATKPHAQVYIDDRGIQFKGTVFPSAQEVRAYRPWNRKKY